MAVKTIISGGTDWADGDVLYAADQNDTLKDLSLIEFTYHAEIVYTGTTAGITEAELLNEQWDDFSDATNVSSTSNALLIDESYILNPALMDDFEDDTVNTTLWGSYATGDGALAESDGELRVNSTTGVTTIIAKTAFADKQAAILLMGDYSDGVMRLEVSSSVSTPANLTTLVADMAPSTYHVVSRDGTNIYVYNVSTGATTTIDASGTGSTMYLEIYNSGGGTPACKIESWWMGSLQSLTGSVTMNANTSTSNALTLYTYPRKFFTDANSTIVGTAKSDGGESFEAMSSTFNNSGLVKVGTPGTAPQDKYNFATSASATKLPAMTYKMLRWME